MEGQTPNKIVYVALFLLSIAFFVLLAIVGGKALVMIALGPCVVFCAYKDYDWFMNHYKAVPLKAILGRDGARLFYIFCGIVIFFIGLKCFYSGASPNYSGCVPE